nr:hypothetical protein [Verrucomicrobiota bacterium]
FESASGDEHWAHRRADDSLEVAAKMAGGEIGVLAALPNDHEFACGSNSSSVWTSAPWRWSW